MAKTFSINKGREEIVFDESTGCARVTVRDENGEASVVLDARDIRDLQVALGTFAEPYPGAWNRLNRYEGE